MLDRRLLGQTILFAITLLGVQGTIYLFQFAAAAQMSPAGYSKVRIIESLVQVGALLATFGMPSVALVRIGVARSERHRRRQMMVLMGTVAAFSVLTAAGFLVATRIGFFQADIEGYVPAVLLIGGLMAFRLLLTAVTQARQHFARLATLSASGCVLAVGTYAALSLSGFDDISAWVIARGSLELAICVGLAAKELWPTSRRGVAARDPGDGGDPDRGDAPLVRAGLPVGASLVARTLVDNGPVLWLAAVGAPAALIAQVGIFVTLVTVSLVPGLVVQGVAVPRLTQNLRNGATSGGYGLLFAGLAAATALLFVCLVMLSTLFLDWGDLARPAILAAGILIVAAKMSASAMGGYLLVINRGGAILALNCLTLAVAIVLATGAIWMDIPLQLLLIVGALGMIEAVAAICYGIAALAFSRSSDASARPDRNAVSIQSVNGPKRSGGNRRRAQ